MQGRPLGVGGSDGGSGVGRLLWCCRRILALVVGWLGVGGKLMLFVASFDA